MYVFFKILSAAFFLSAVWLWSGPVFAGSAAPGADQGAFLPPATDPHGAIVGPDDRIWFHRLGPPQALSPEQLRKTVVAGYRKLRGESSEGIDFSFLSDDDEDRMVFLSWSCGRRRARVVDGRGRGWAAATADAVRNARERGANRDSVNYVKFDAVQKVVLFPRWQADRHRIPDPGFRGLAFDPAAPFAFIPEQILYGRLFTGQGRIDPMRMAELLVEEGDLEKLGLFKNVAAYAGEQPLFSFDTQGVFYAGRDPEIIYSGHVLPNLLDRSDLHKAAAGVVEFLTGIIDRHGRIAVDRDQWTVHTEHGQDSLSSLALACWGLARYAGLTANQEAAIGAQRLADRLVEYLEPVSVAGDTRALVEYVHADLRTNSYAVLAWLEMAELTGHQEYRNLAVALARFLVLQRQPTGALLRRRMVPGDELEFGISLDSSAAAIVALVRLYEHTEDQRYLEMADEAMGFLLQHQLQPAEPGQVPSAPWLMAAAGALYPHNRDARLLHQIERLAFTYHTLQLVNRVPYADVIGSFGAQFSTTRVAGLTSGMVSAVALLRDEGRVRPAENLLEIMHLGMIFHLQAQLSEAETMYMRSPADFIGAFRDDIRGMNVSLPAQSRQLLSLVAVLEFMEAGAMVELPLGEQRLAALRQSRRLLFRFGHGLPPGIYGE